MSTVIIAFDTLIGLCVWGYIVPIEPRARSARFRSGVIRGALIGATIGLGSAEPFPNWTAGLATTVIASVVSGAYAAIRVPANLRSESEASTADR